MYRLPFLILPPVNSSVQSLPPFPTVFFFSAFGTSQISEHNNHRNEAAGPIDTAKKTALALFRGFDLDLVKPLSRAHEEGSSSRDNIDREIRRERERESAERDWRDFLSLSLSPRVRLRLTSLHNARTSRACDRSRASFEKQCKRERHAGLSFLPTFLHWTPGSCSLPVPLSLGFPCPSTS